MLAMRGIRFWGLHSIPCFLYRSGGTLPKNQVDPAILGNGVVVTLRFAIRATMTMQLNRPGFTATWLL